MRDREASGPGRIANGAVGRACHLARRRRGPHHPRVSRFPRIPIPVVLLAAVVAFASACTRDEQAAPQAQPATNEQPATQRVTLPDDDCNLSTPLVPGVPGSPGNLIKSERNPNGDSELAVLMRRFVDDLRRVRKLAEAGEPIEPLYPSHRFMRCSWPTKPDERNEAFDARAQGYLASVRAFDHEPNQGNYNAMITGCIACHSVSCGGPLDFIDGMKWQ
jgi:hypothetical protein